MNREERRQLRLRVWNALHTYYWDRSKLGAWYERLCDNTGDVSDIVRGMDKYPDIPFLTPNH